MAQQIIGIFLCADDDASHLDCGERILFQVFCISQIEIKFEPEITSLTLNALKADLSSHELDQLLADGSAQTGSAVPPCDRFFSLRKAVEYSALCFEWYAYTRIFYGKAQAD